MSHYTTELRFICEQYAGLSDSGGFNDVDEIIALSRDKIFSFDYPIFDTEYKPTLETKIIRHFYTREICAETVGRWKLFLQAEMNEIMPYFNQLYNSQLLEFNPFYDVDLSETGSSEANRTNSGTANTQGGGSATSQDSGTDRSVTNSQDVTDRWDYYSDTPQGGVGNLANLSYLTNARHITDDTDGSNSDTTITHGKKNVANTSNTSTTTETGTAQNIDEYAKRIIGKNGGASYSKLLQEFRDTFLNIDMMVIESLNDLFMGVW